MTEPAAGGPSDAELRKFLADARRFARTASKDDQVVEGAAAQAVAQLVRYWDAVTPTDQARRGWLKVVAVNAARKEGGRLHAEVPFGRAGSFLPPTDDAESDERAAALIAEMHLGLGSLGSYVASKLDFEKRWAMLSVEHRTLLKAKYADGLPSKEIARQRGRGETGAAIDHKLTEAKRAPRLVLEDLLHPRET